MATIQISPLGTFQTNVFAESAAEIVGFDPLSKLLFVTNADSNSIDVLDASDPNNLSLVQSIDLSPYGAGPNSVAVKNGMIAVAVEAETKQDNGQVVFFDTSGTFLNAVTVGSLPDMLTFTPDGKRLIVANEGEPNDDYSNDPEGSISIINISDGVENAGVLTADFNSLVKQALLDQGVRVFGLDASVAQDLEPEFITVSQDSSTAWVTLQENNALAKVNLHTGKVDILPLGYKDHSLRGNELDASNEDGAINIRNWSVFGMYQPDSISSYESRGKTYLVMANEGDSRIRPDGDLEDDDGTILLEEGVIFNEEERVEDLVLDPTAFPNAAALQKEENLGRLKITNTLGDTDGDGDFDELYAYGARSFSIRDGDGRLVYDSGADLERITAHFVPDNFNSDDEENGSFDDRSDDKGPEPEALTVGEVNGRTYAFVGLERVGGIVVYDITNPSSPDFIQYINLRNFEGNLEAGIEAGTAGDSSPEGVTFIAAADSPTGEPLLAVANEISGSTTLYQISDTVTPPAGAKARDNGNNTLYGSGENDELYGLGGHDYINAKAGNDTVYAGDGNDVVYGKSGDDLILGEGGSDRLYAGRGNDMVWAGSGNDQIYGGKGDDNIVAGEGHDRVYGGSGSDFIDGGLGNDVIFAGGGDDFINGGYGYEWIYGGRGTDTVTMSYRHDGVKIDLANNRISFFDVGGADRVYGVENAIGTEYSDIVKGDDKNNELRGLGGDDHMVGVDEHSLYAGKGEKDALLGGLGADRFVVGGINGVYYNDGDSTTTGENDFVRIRDFKATQGDVIQLSGDSTDYALGSAQGSTGVFLKTDGADELVAVVDGLDVNTDLAGSGFEYV